MSEVKVITVMEPVDDLTEDFRLISSYTYSDDIADRLIAYCEQSGMPVESFGVSGFNLRLNVDLASDVLKKLREEKSECVQQ